MILRKGEYAYIDGTLFSVDGLQSAYLARQKTGIVLQYLDGHRIEIKYESKTVIQSKWKELLALLQDLVDSNVMLSFNELMLVRLDSIEHIEFDGVDNRMALLYKSGECFIFDFMSATITRALFWEILGKYFGVNKHDRSMISAISRHRADFWQRVTAEINGMLVGEIAPNKQYWERIDKAVINAKPPQNK